MDRLFDDLARAYDGGIQVPGKEAHFLVLVAVVCSWWLLPLGPRYAGGEFQRLITAVSRSQPSAETVAVVR